jgi:hypothetical protein
LGKYYPASANSDSYAESFAVSRRNTDIVSGAISISRWIAVTDICISHSQPGRQRAGKPDAYANNFASCVSKALRNQFPADLNPERVYPLGRGERLRHVVQSQINAPALRILNLAQRLSIAAVS